MIKFKNIVRDILTEQDDQEIRNKGLFNRLSEKWKNECPEITTEDMVKIFKRHEAIKNSINEDNPGVVTFLRKYDGEFGNKKYSLQNLRDITSIELGHLVEFLIEFGRFTIDYPCAGNENEKRKVSREELRQVFNQNGPQKTPQKLELSKEMWFSNTNAVVNENGFRVYSILNKEQAVWMGYYYQTLHKQAFIENLDNRRRNNVNAPWCVTWRGENFAEYRTNENGENVGAPLFSHGSNMYGNYRNIHGKTFYFVIDEAKPETDRYHLSALQINRVGAYTLTSMYNDGDNGMSWEDIVDIYPKLKDHKDKIAYRPLDEDELDSISILDRINENPGNQFEFARQNQAIKNEYIDNGGTIKTVISWKSMNGELKTKYIDLMTNEDVLTRISTFDLLQAIVTTPGFDKKLQRRFEIINFNGGVSTILSNLLKSEFKLIRKSIDKPNIGVYERRGSEEYGLMNYNTLSWVNFQGTKYDASFKIKDYSTIFDETGSSYYVEIMVQNGTNKKMYLVTPLDEGNGIDTYIISEKRWSEIKDKFNEVDQYLSTSTDFEPSQHSDVNEIKRD